MRARLRVGWRARVVARMRGVRGWSRCLPADPASSVVIGGPRFDPRRLEPQPVARCKRDRRHHRFQRHRRIGVALETWRRSPWTSKSITPAVKPSNLGYFFSPVSRHTSRISVVCVRRPFFLFFFIIRFFPCFFPVFCW